MAVINTLVAKSDNIRAAALNLNAKAFEARQTLAGIWDLKPTATAPPPPESTFQLDMKNATDESVVGEGDERVKVEEQDFMPGGKYRCKFPCHISVIEDTDGFFSHCETFHPLRVPKPW